MIYDNVCELDIGFLNYLNHLDEKYAKNYQVFIILKSHTVPNFNKTSKINNKVKKLFKDKIYYWRRTYIQDCFIHLDFVDDKGSQDST